MRSMRSRIGLVQTFLRFDTPAYNTQEVFYARLDSEIYKQEQLFQALYYLLWFPGYFGFNWNALEDCLKDFSWISEKKIVLAHRGLPQIPDQELRIYLEILGAAVEKWAQIDRHTFEVVFEKKDMSKALEVLR
jgi:RNAse (barnase) inhibitor barstar